MFVSKDSFILFVFPFHFHAEDYDLLRNVLQSEPQASDWGIQAFPESDLLVSSLCRQLSRHGSEDPLSSWKMSGDATHAWGGYGSKWQLCTGRKSRVPFRFESVRLHLFQTGFGFLVTEVVSESNEFASWLDLLHFFRFADGARGVRLHAERNLENSTSSEAIEFEYDGTFEELISDTLRTLLARDGWWSPTFNRHRLIPFYSLALENSDDDDAMKHLYQLRNLFPSHTHLHPSSVDISTDHPGNRPYAHNQWFVFSLEGGGLHARNRPENPFFSSTLVAHLKNEYMMLFLLTLHQRFHLHKLTHDVAVSWLDNDDASSRASLNVLLDADLWYSTNYRFSQVAYSDHYQNFYSKWQSVFRIKDMSEEVKSKLSELNSHLQAAETQRIENKLTAYGALVGLPSLAAAILALNVAGFTPSPGWNLQQTAVVLAISAILGLVIFFVWLRR